MTQEESVYVAYTVKAMPNPTVPSVMMKCAGCDEEVWVDATKASLAETVTVLCSRCALKGTLKRIDKAVAPVFLALWKTRVEAAQLRGYFNVEDREETFLHFPSPSRYAEFCRAMGRDDFAACFKILAELEAPASNTIKGEG